MNIRRQKKESGITVKINRWYYLNLLTSETLKLLGITKNRTTKTENGENMPHLKLTEVVLLKCSTLYNCQQWLSTLFTSLVYLSSK